MPGLVVPVPFPAVLHAGEGGQLCPLAGKAQAGGVLGGVGLHIGFELFKGPLQDGDVRPGGVVLVFHAGAAGHLALGQLFQDGGGQLHFLPQGPLQVLQGDVPGAEEGGLCPHHRHHGGLHPHRAGPAVQDQGQAALHIGPDVLGGGGAGPARPVGRGGRKGAAAGLDDLAHHRVAGHPDAHRVQPGAALVRHLGAARHDDGQRPGPEGRGQQPGPLGELADQTRQHPDVVDVDDEGVVLGAALGRKDLFHRAAVAGVGGDAVHRLGGQGDDLPLPQQGGSPGDARLVCRAEKGFDAHNRLRFLFHSCSWPSFSACSCRTRASSTWSRPPSMILSRLWTVRPMRWSVQRSWGKL